MEIESPSGDLYCHFVHYDFGHLKFDDKDHKDGTEGSMDRTLLFTLSKIKVYFITKEN